MLNNLIKQKMQAMIDESATIRSNSNCECFEGYPGMRLTDYVKMCLAEGVSPELAPVETSYDEIGSDGLEDAFVVDPYGDVRTDPFELMESSRNAQRRQILKSMEKPNPSPVPESIPTPE
ncbi:hypothetical protein, partial [Alistipes putredinis]|uniref:hypothetical protein n=1 Tax=Alistipes putredinis TaxID=28117 RepID=UPI003AEF5373